jgi:coiled-coil domain-containing protein 55
MKLSFNLSPSKSAAAGAAPPLKRPAAFASLDDDEPIDAAPTLSIDRNSSVASNKQLLAQNLDTMSKVMKKRMEEEMKVDATVYEYDEVWDKIQEVKTRQKEAKEADSMQRKVRRFDMEGGSLELILFIVQPKYIKGLLSTAATRKLDHLRAEEKMMQREREREGDEFMDKESFVTQAYKDQMAEVRRAEEEEKRREGVASTDCSFSLHLIVVNGQNSPKKTTVVCPRV